QIVVGPRFAPLSEVFRVVAHDLEEELAHLVDVVVGRHNHTKPARLAIGVAIGMTVAIAMAVAALALLTGWKAQLFTHIVPASHGVVMREGIDDEAFGGFRLECDG